MEMPSTSLVGKKLELMMWHLNPEQLLLKIFLESSKRILSSGCPGCCKTGASQKELTLHSMSQVILSATRTRPPAPPSDRHSTRLAAHDQGLLASTSASPGGHFTARSLSADPAKRQLHDAPGRLNEADAETPEQGLNPHRELANAGSPQADSGELTTLGAMQLLETPV